MRVYQLLLSCLIFCVATGQASGTNLPADTAYSVDTVYYTKQPTGISVKKVRLPGRSIDQYVLYVPSTYNTHTNKRWPVLIFLHGKGERGDDINLVKKMGIPWRLRDIPNFPFVVIAPQCKLNVRTWDVASLNALWPDIVRLYRIDTSRVYLTGLSMGGNGTWMWGMNDPDKFAALAPMCGWGNTSKACALKDKPMKVFHNADDDTVPVSGSRNLVKAVRDCGNTKITYTERPTGGHDAWSIPYYDQKFYDWLLKQSK